MLSSFSSVGHFVTICTIVHQAPLSMGFPRQGYWSGEPCPSPGDLPDPAIKSPALAGWFFSTALLGKPMLLDDTKDKQKDRTRD